MARKGRDSLNQLPVDHYRKQIGKQEYRKLKSDIKEARKQSKEGSGSHKEAQLRFKEASIAGAIFVILVILLYAGLIFYLEKQ